jgi:hypothetical protein
MQVIEILACLNPAKAWIEAQVFTLCVIGWGERKRENAAGFGVQDEASDVFVGLKS